jgi:hypothetical protein
VTPMGKQTLVRFRNRIPATSTAFPAHPPCTSTTRKGRPLAVHHHGSASLAPYDGFAVDSICSDESKDYVSHGFGMFGGPSQHKHLNAPAWATHCGT